jgi:hypothetical protein
MAGTTRFTIVADAICADGACGKLSGVVFDPVAQAVTHLVVERHGLERLVPRWEDALAGALDLFFEVNLPSPGRYRAWLRDHLGERAPIPHLKKQAEARGRGWKERRGPTPCCSLLPPE